MGYREKKPLISYSFHRRKYILAGYNFYVV